jgi:hypothetical protein
MRHTVAAWVMVPVLWGQARWAQQPAASAEPNDFKLASTNAPGSQDPQVSLAPQAGFYIYAPDAQGVRVNPGNTALTKHDDGFRTGVTKLLDPGFHCYTINVDGVSVADPVSEGFFGYGSMQMFDITVNKLDMFAYMAGFSRALPPHPMDRICEDPKGFNEKAKAFFLGAGGRECQANSNIWNLHEALGKAGIKSVCYESPGTAHEWLTWRRHLCEFSPLLFKD